MTIENTIIEYMKYVQENPLENMSDIADHFFKGVIPGAPKKIVVPGLLSLAPSKRAVISNIIKSRTNIEVNSSEDTMHGFLKMKSVGDMFRSIPEIIHGIKLFKK